MSKLPIHRIERRFTDCHTGTRYLPKDGCFQSEDEKQIARLIKAEALSVEPVTPQKGEVVNTAGKPKTDPSPAPAVVEDDTESKGGNPAELEVGQVIQVPNEDGSLPDDGGWNKVTFIAEDGTPSLEPCDAPEETTKKVAASPAIVKYAAEKKVDLALLTGTGKNGALKKVDVDTYLEEAAKQNQE